MQVCSLIDKNPDSEEPLPSSMASKGEPARQQQSLGSSTLNDNSQLNPKEVNLDLQEKSQENHPAEPLGLRDSQANPQIQTIPSSKTVPESVAMSILGPGVRGFLMTPSLFGDVIRLRTEQEKTEQEKLKLELVSKTKAILEYAVEKNISPETLILLSRENQSHPMIPPPAQQQQQPQPQPRPSAQYSYPGDTYATRHTESVSGQYTRSPYIATSPSQQARQYENSNNASAVDPMNFRFGGVPKFNPQSPQNISNRRPRSPAKLGAIAVANLANPVTPYRPANRTIPFHQRHYSMPTEAMVSTSNPVDRRYSRQRNPPVSQSINPGKSPESHSASMQVRPLPARPLHNPHGKGASFSQDSMSQHQQVIQFHHWISENPGEKPAEKYEHKRNNSVSSQSLNSKSHKRHKSTDISMDMQRVGSMGD